MDWCYMSKRSGESVNHLLLYCPIAFELWSMVWSLFGVIWVTPQSVTDLFASWQGPFGRQRNIDLWRAVLHCVLWCLWRERNSRCFEGIERSILEIKSLLHSLIAWCSVFTSFFCSNFFVMLDHCNFRSWCNPFHVHSRCTWGFWFMNIVIYQYIYIYIKAESSCGRPRRNLMWENMRSPTWGFAMWRFNLHLASLTFSH